MMDTLRTERLTLRRPEPRDLERFTTFYGTDRSSMNGGPLEPGQAWRGFAAHLGAWEINGFGMFAMVRTADDHLIGLVGPYYPGEWPEREIGWTVFDPADEGKGYAREGAEAALAHAFGTLGWDTAVSYIHKDNARSRALAERLGAAVDPQAVRPPRGEAALVYRHPHPGREGRG